MTEQHLFTNADTKAFVFRTFALKRRALNYKRTAMQSGIAPLSGKMMRSAARTTFRFRRVMRTSASGAAVSSPAPHRADCPCRNLKLQLNH